MKQLSVPGTSPVALFFFVYVFSKPGTFRFRFPGLAVVQYYQYWHKTGECSVIYDNEIYSNVQLYMQTLLSTQRVPGTFPVALIFFVYVLDKPGTFRFRFPGLTGV